MVVSEQKYNNAWYVLIQLRQYLQLKLVNRKT